MARSKMASQSLQVLVFLTFELDAGGAGVAAFEAAF